MAFGLLTLACGGDEGADGERGAEGTAGANGRDGERGAEGEQGAAGLEGPEGKPGELRVYGDGSAGNVTVEGSVRLEELLADGNTQFENLTIPEGAVLEVPSGVTLRATGVVTVSGTLVVRPTGRGGSISLNANDALPSIVTPEPGIAYSAPGTPVIVNTNTTAFAGTAGVGIGGEARFRFDFGRIGGGAGWFGPQGGLSQFVRGGGAVRVLARAAVEVTGTIQAHGGIQQSSNGSCSACSGGGGGVVLIASKQALSLSATAVVDVRGGMGGASRNVAAFGVSPAIAIGAGGGGGGGCVHLIAPAIADEATVRLEGGAPGQNDTLADLPTLRSGGFGGGASCGDGGHGGRLNGGSPFPPQAGRVGLQFRTEADPTALL